MSIHWSKKPTMLANNCLVATDRGFGAIKGTTFTIMDHGYRIDLMVFIPSLDEKGDFDEVFHFKTVAAAKSFVTKNFGR